MALRTHNVWTSTPEEGELALLISLYIPLPPGSLLYDIPESDQRIVCTLNQVLCVRHILHTDIARACMARAGSYRGAVWVPLVSDGLAVDPD